MPLHVGNRVYEVKDGRLPRLLLTWPMNAINVSPQMTNEDMP
jgi:hypothetical protein